MVPGTGTLPVFKPPLWRQEGVPNILVEEAGTGMYICHCEAVTDASIRSAIEAGARTVAEVSEHCRAGSGCGGCWPALFALLEQGLALDEVPAGVT